MANLAPAILRARSADRWSRKDKLASIETKKRPQTRTAGGWIADLTALGKAVALCSNCRRKFDPKAVNYRRERLPGPGWGWCGCDGCRHPYSKCWLYVTRSDD